MKGDSLFVDQRAPILSVRVHMPKLPDLLGIEPGPSGEFCISKEEGSKCTHELVEEKFYRSKEQILKYHQTADMNSLLYLEQLVAR